MNISTALFLSTGIAIATVSLPPGSLTAQQTETPSQRRMAEMMAQQMDMVWDQDPEAGTANIRILMTHGGSPFAGKISIYTEFSFRAVRRGGQSSQGFNPNENGRWVYEGLGPGAYELQVVGSERFAGFEWSQSVTVSVGDKPVFEIELPDPA